MLHGGRATRIFAAEIIPYRGAASIFKQKQLDQRLADRFSYAK
jgi:hypothetical protein